MSTEAALKAVNDLISFFGEKLNEEQKSFWVKKLYWADPRDLVETCDRIKTKFKRFPILEDFLKVVDEARAHRAAIQSRQTDTQAKEFFDARNADSQFARDCVEAINELLSTPKGDTKAFLKVKYEVAKRVLDKYPNMTEDAKAPLKAMIREAKDEYRNILNTEEARAAV